MDFLRITAEVKVVTRTKISGVIQVIIRRIKEWNNVNHYLNQNQTVLK